MCKVSVIIPAYNTEAYMANCLKSLLEQTLTEIEVIVVDDGSTDDTLQVLREYEERYPAVLRVFHKENGGQASARNLGLKHAQGEYLAFVDSDDWVAPEMYEMMYEKAKKENADVVICNMVEHFPDKEICYDLTDVPNKLGYAGSSCNKLFRRTFAEDVKFPEGLWYEDFEYSAIQLMKAEHVAVLKEGLYHYNCRDGSTMRNTNTQKNKDILTVLNHISAYAEEHGWAEKYEKELEFLYVEHILFASINRIQAQRSRQKNEVISFLRKEVVGRYPDFHKSEYFQKYGIKKRVVIYLNSIGLSSVVKMIFDVKRILRRQKG